MYIGIRVMWPTPVPAAERNTWVQSCSSIYNAVASVGVKSTDKIGILLKHDYIDSTEGSNCSLLVQELNILPSLIVLTHCIWLITFQYIIIHEIEQK